MGSFCRGPDVINFRSADGELYDFRLARSDYDASDLCTLRAGYKFKLAPSVALPSTSISWFIKGSEFRGPKQS